MKDTIEIAGEMHELPCIIPNLSNADHHAHWAWGSSRLRASMISPAEGRRPKPFDADAAAEGTAFHWMISEPAHYDRYVAFDPLHPDKGDQSNVPWNERIEASRNSNLYKSARDEWQTKTGGVGVMIKRKTHARLERMAAALWEYEWLPKELDTLPCHVEESYFWRDQRTGIVCKARPDIAIDESSRRGVEALWIDLKTSHSDVSAEAWGKASAQHGYHIQEAFTRRAAFALGIDLPPERFKFIVVGKRTDPPVRIYWHPAYQLARANAAIDQALALERWCREKKVWPKNHPPAVTVHPQYAFYDHDRAMSNMREFRRRIAPESFSSLELEEMQNV